MPELPDVTVYVEHVRRRLGGHPLEKVHILSPFVLRSVDPPARELEGKIIVGARRLGKRIVVEVEGSLFAVIHLMIAGRLHYLAKGSKLAPKRTLLALETDDGLLTLTEAGTKKRASLHFVRGEEALAEHDPKGLDVVGADEPAFAAALRAESHTLKRSLTDPRIFDGIGNAYSDEILHRARLSPVTMSRALSDAEVARLHAACREVLTEWTDRLRAEAGDAFPEGVTAFRPEMAVHGKFGEPCPVCGTAVQRIVYADRETNYCPGCQTGGKLLADRAMSRLLGADFPRTLEELEAHRASRRLPGK